MNTWNIISADKTQPHQDVGSQSKELLPSITISRVQGSYHTAVEPKENNTPVVTLALEASNLTMTAGKTIAIVGPSGAGKSTLLKIFAGLLPPQKWDASLPYQQLNGMTAFVSQQPFLFQDSLRTNLLYGIPLDQHPSLQPAIESALRTVDLFDEIKRMPQGLDTVFNTLHPNLSGGQIQRFVIARAILHARPILLLDEATSAIDSAAEQSLTRNLIETARTQRSYLLAVTHRLTWIDLYDEVWFLEQGRVIFQMTPAALKNEARYQKFCRQLEAGSDG